jgi:hypothetical protein
MEEEFATYEIALKLKELGFKKECLAFYDKNEDLHLISYGRVTYNNSHDSIAIHPYYRLVCSAPLWQQVIDWFREEHGVIIGYLNVNIKTDLQFMWSISTIKEIDLELPTMSDRCFGNYYKAREQAILKAIEICKTIKL